MDNKLKNSLKKFWKAAASTFAKKEDVVQADYSVQNEEDPAYIKNKPAGETIVFNYFSGLTNRFLNKSYTFKAEYENEQNNVRQYTIDNVPDTITHRNATGGNYDNYTGPIYLRYKSNITLTDEDKAFIDELMSDTYNLSGSQLEEIENLYNLIKDKKYNDCDWANVEEGTGNAINDNSSSLYVNINGNNRNVKICFLDPKNISENYRNYFYVFYIHKTENKYYIVYGFESYNYNNAWHDENEYKEAGKIIPIEGEYDGTNNNYGEAYRDPFDDELIKNQFLVMEIDVENKTVKPCINWDEQVVLENMAVARQVYYKSSEDGDYTGSNYNTQKKYYINIYKNVTFPQITYRYLPNSIEAWLKPAYGFKNNWDDVINVFNGKELMAAELAAYSTYNNSEYTRTSRYGSTFTNSDLTYTYNSEEVTKEVYDCSIGELYYILTKAADINAIKSNFIDERYYTSLTPKLISSLENGQFTLYFSGGNITEYDSNSQYHNGYRYGSSIWITDLPEQFSSDTGIYAIYKDSETNELSKVDTITGDETGTFMGIAINQDGHAWVIRNVYTRYFYPIEYLPVYYYDSDESKEKKTAYNTALGLTYQFAGWNNYDIDSYNSTGTHDYAIAQLWYMLSGDAYTENSGNDENGDWYRTYSIVNHTDNNYILNVGSEYLGTVYETLNDKLLSDNIRKRTDAIVAPSFHNDIFVDTYNKRYGIQINTTNYYTFGLHGMNNIPTTVDENFWSQVSSAAKNNKGGLSTGTSAPYYSTGYFCYGQGTMPNRITNYFKPIKDLAVLFDNNWFYYAFYKVTKEIYDIQSSSFDNRSKFTYNDNYYLGLSVTPERKVVKFKFTKNDKITVWRKTSDSTVNVFGDEVTVPAAIFGVYDYFTDVQYANFAITFCTYDDSTGTGTWTNPDNIGNYTTSSSFVGGSAMQYLNNNLFSNNNTNTAEWKAYVQEKLNTNGNPSYIMCHSNNGAEAYYDYLIRRGTIKKLDAEFVPEDRVSLTSTDIPYGLYIADTNNVLYPLSVWQKGYAKNDISKFSRIVVKSDEGKYYAIPLDQPTSKVSPFNTTVTITDIKDLIQEDTGAMTGIEATSKFLEWFSDEISPLAKLIRPIITNNKKLYMPTWTEWNSFRTYLTDSNLSQYTQLYFVANYLNQSSSLCSILNVSNAVTLVSGLDSTGYTNYECLYLYGKHTRTWKNSYRVYLATESVYNVILFEDVSNITFAKYNYKLDTTEQIINYLTTSPDWNENTETNISYINNRTHYKTETADSTVNTIINSTTQCGYEYENLSDIFTATGLTLINTLIPYMKESESKLTGDDIPEIVRGLYITMNDIDYAIDSIEIGRSPISGWYSLSGRSATRYYREYVRFIFDKRWFSFYLLTNGKYGISGGGNVYNYITGVGNVAEGSDWFQNKSNNYLIYASRIKYKKYTLKYSKLSKSYLPELDWNITNELDPGYIKNKTHSCQFTSGSYLEYGWVNAGNSKTITLAKTNFNNPAILLLPDTNKTQCYISKGAFNVNGSTWEIIKSEKYAGTFSININGANVEFTVKNDTDTNNTYDTFVYYIGNIQKLPDFYLPGSVYQRQSVTDTSFMASPNVLYLLSPTADTTITLNDTVPTTELSNSEEFTFRFTFGDTVPAMTITSTAYESLVWKEAPSFEANSVYDINISEGIGVCLKVQ